MVYITVKLVENARYIGQNIKYLIFLAQFLYIFKNQFSERLNLFRLFGIFSMRG